MTKKLVSLFLALTMMLSLCGTVLADDAEYAEHFEITLGTASAIADDAWASNYFNCYIQDKFNVSFKPYSASAGFDEVTNLWISTGDMPDWMTAGNDLEGLMEYADQGMLAALPEGWEERYPALYAEATASALEQYCTIDGKWYVIPRVVFSPNFPLDFAENAMDHVAWFYRTDWAQEAGVEMKPMMTIAEMKEAVKAIVEAKKAAGENVYGLSAPSDKIVPVFLRSEVPYYKQVYEVDGQFVLGAAQEGVITAIKEAKEWYDEGLIDPDFFSRTTDDCRNIFYIGGSFMTQNDGGPVHCGVLGNGLIDNNPEMTETPAMGVVNAKAANGEDFFVAYSGSFWRTLVFSPKLENEPEKFERILAILNDLAQVDTIVKLRLGEQGVDWDYDENGRPYVIKAYQYDDASGANILYHLSPSSQDAYGYYNPSVPAWAVDMAKAQMSGKTSNLSSDKMPTKAQINFFDRWNSDAKKNYDSIGWVDEVVRIIMAGDVDVATEWNNFIENNKGLWQPLLDELNATLK